MIQMVNDLVPCKENTTENDKKRLKMVVQSLRERKLSVRETLTSEPPYLSHLGILSSLVSISPPMNMVISYYGNRHHLGQEID